MKRMLKWIFIDYENDLAVLIAIPFAYIVAILLLHLLDFKPLIEGILLLIPIIFILGVTFRVITETVRRLLGDKNKQVGFGHGILAVIIIATLSTLVL